jgi:hypothetical protein
MINIKSTKKDAAQELKIGLFGKSGTGKSTIISTLPVKPEHVLIIDVEHGLEVLRKYEYATIDLEEVQPDFKVEDQPHPMNKHWVNRIRAVIGYLQTKDGLNGYQWIVMDSFTMLAEKIKADMEKNPAVYGLLNKHGVLDGLKLYGELKKLLTSINDAFLRLKGCSKLVIFGAEEKGQDEEDKRMELLIPGSFSDLAMFHYDEFWSTRVVKDGERREYQVVTNGDGYYVCKSRMSGGSETPLNVYEPANLADLIAKCYGKEKEVDVVEEMMA